MKINGAKNIIKKDADLFIKSNRNEIIIEFKCNIDMIEKDLFKLMLAPRKYKKILFIWEKRDNSKKAKSDKESSYITILKYAKEKKWIDEYFYFPLLGKNGRKVAPSRLKKEIEKFKLSIKSYINAA
ncbi:MAG: hypothetical protein NTW44_07985 [Nitrospirae bacterium]|nr:hypothetical protein [Nitrospirota bacterium]